MAKQQIDESPTKMWVSAYLTQPVFCVSGGFSPAQGEWDPIPERGTEQHSAQDVRPGAGEIHPHCKQVYSSIRGHHKNVL